MRIIGGEARGRRLRPVRGRQVRPTADRVREALFSVLESRLGTLSGLASLDLFAGSGALGLEALSRGGKRAVFVESDPAAARTVEENLQLCGLADRARVVQTPVERFLAGGAGGDRFGLVFLDPPYDADLGEATLVALVPDLLTPGAMVVLEHGARQSHPDRAGCLQRIWSRQYGQTGLSLYRRAETMPAASSPMRA